MLPPFRPAVFACPMRYIHDEKPEEVWPPPYPAWPEIADPSTFYTFPTLNSHPAIERCSWFPRWLGTSSDLTDREKIYLMFPDDAEELLAKLPPTTENSLLKVWDLCGGKAMSMGYVRLYAALGIADPEWRVFAFHHEGGHFDSFQISRPTILEVNRIASGIFELFKKLTLSECETFWDDFQERNDTLVRYLDQALMLEELRAHFYSLWGLHPKIVASIVPDLRKVIAAEDASKPSGSPILRTDLFDMVVDSTKHEDFVNPWETAYWMTYLADYSPENPLKRLHYLCKRAPIGLTEKKLDEVSSRKFKNGWIVFVKEPKNRTPEISFWACDDVEADTPAHHWCPSEEVDSNLRELVFLESLRQQCAKFGGVSLVCPFQQRGRTCCGFGHYLRAIWEQVRPEYRSAKAILISETGEEIKEIVVRPPREVCLHYGLG